MTIVETLSVEAVLGDKGVFAQNNPKFQARKEQLSMAAAVAKAIENNANSLIEAGTGVGKTFAYLVPAILSGKQVVISTGTKNLQDQLFKKDIPIVTRTLGIHPQTALLKGRNNYLCEYRLESTLSSGRLPDPVAVKHLSMVNKWRNNTLSGDLTELKPLPDNSPVISYVTSTADNCLGQECPFIDKCFVAAAREKARKAKVLVVNHHLLLADLVLKSDGFGELLPDTDIFIVDEAHHLTKTAYQFYGNYLSSRQINELCQEVELQYRTEVTDSKDLMLDAQRLSKAAKDFRLALGEYDNKSEWAPDKEILKAFNNLTQKITRLFEVVKVNSARTKVLESCFERLNQYKHFISQFEQKPDGSFDFINWYETIKSGFILHSTPINIGELFQQSRQRYSQSSWVMTSATLTVNNSFDHFIRTLNWKNIETLMLPSSFDYQNQALLYLPRDLPSPSDEYHIKAMIDAVLPLLRITRGRSFLLFTSHKALQKAAEIFDDYKEFNYFVQGQSSKEELLNQFVQSDDAILLATGSFWEGVDVSGDNLVMVIIDKLPFASPDDPLLNAKINQCRKNKGNPFMEIQLPDAILSLKQGVGRLIRSVEDRGVVCITDPRLIGKHYGKQFLDSLPNFKRTRESQLVEEFLTDIMSVSTSSDENENNQDKS
ncbi:MAG: ATP-dependent DNA helicase [Gammaproteobacteria bacterium]|nr:ATP-dependent DNA helicase [Gammaproteobacteria bacterium]